MGVSKPQPLIIPPELEKEMTPAVKAFVLVLLGRIEELEGKVRIPTLVGHLFRFEFGQ